MTAALFVMAAGWFVLARRRGSLAGTTLTAPWAWTAVAWTVVCGVEAAAARSPASYWESWRFVAATGLFTPIVALLGAKRPQDRGWVFVVATLWGIAALPAGENWVAHPGQALEVGDARGWFLLAMILLGLIVLAPTRHLLGAIALAAAQLALLKPHLPVPLPDSFGPSWGVSLLGVAVLSGFWSTRPLSPLSAARRSSLDRTWLRFRNAFGLLWGLRVVERMNAVGRRQGWRSQLSWQGFRDRQSGRLQAVPEAERAAVQIALTNLLRRFVSPDWLDYQDEPEID
ncbi:MAG: hypothetical protein QGG36_27325 [Pirellulaceae bacterium]|jgi:hypothetical protein|nr:hypothetical protein [Pirellulaceae bacterium]